LTKLVQIAGSFRRKPESRNEKHTRALSIDESLLCAPSRSTDKPKKHGIYNADIGAHDNQQATEAFDRYDEMVSEISVKHEAQLQKERKKYTKLDRECDQLYEDWLEAKKERDDLRNYRKMAEREKSKLQKRYEESEREKSKLEKHCEDFEREKSELQKSLKWVSSRYDYVIQDTIKPFARNRGMQWNDQTAETIYIVLDALTADAIEANTLRDQVRVLQREMLANVDKVQGVSDEQLGREFRNLIALIKTLSRTIEFSPGADIVELCGKPLLLRDVKPHHWKGRAGKKYMMEAWVWCVLLSFVFQDPFAIFGEVGDNLDMVWKDIFGSHYVHAWPVPSRLCETWRYTTVEQLAEHADLAPVAAGKSEPATEYSRLQLSMSKIRKDIYYTIAEQVARVSAPTKPPQIDDIIDKAFALALQMSTQRCRLQLTYPFVGAEFHKDSMESMPDPDGEDMEKGNVAFIVHPGLTKWGDAHGKNLDHRFDIVSSLVQLEAPQPGNTTGNTTTKADTAALEHNTGVSSR
jgi:hypothetical protein